MSIAFSRSIRLMQQDSFRLGLASLIALLIFLIAWLAWFFLARLPLYAASRKFTMTQTGSVQATFAAEDLAQILPGQGAILSLPETAGQPAQAFQGEVMSVRQGQVEIYIFSNAGVLPPPQNTVGEVKIEIGTFSPATWVLRSAGQVMGKP